jgi:hypothetical protein
MPIVRMTYVALFPLVLCSFGCGGNAVVGVEQTDGAVGGDASVNDGSADTSVNDSGIDSSLDGSGQLTPLSSDCKNLGSMIGIRLKGGACYLMDAKKVTRGEYYAAVKNGPPKASLPQCATIEGSGPREEPSIPYASGDLCRVDGTGAGGELPDPRMHWPPSEGEQDLPMVCVNFCDIQAYCESVGKRLCNPKAQNPGPSNSTLDDPSTDEWYNACSGGGQRPYPWGSEPVAACKNLHPSCEGAYAGLIGLGLELTGHTSDGHQLERVSECSAPRDDAGAPVLSPIDSFNAYFGFRCCDDP